MWLTCSVPVRRCGRASGADSPCFKRCRVLAHLQQVARVPETGLQPAARTISTRQPDRQPEGPAMPLNHLLSPELLLVLSLLVAAGVGLALASLAVGGRPAHR